MTAPPSMDSLWRLKNMRLEASSTWKSKGVALAAGLGGLLVSALRQQVGPVHCCILSAWLSG